MQRAAGGHSLLIRLFGMGGGELVSLSATAWARVWPSHTSGDSLQRRRRVLLLPGDETPQCASRSQIKLREFGLSADLVAALEDGR